MKRDGYRRCKNFFLDELMHSKIVGRFKFPLFIHPNIIYVWKLYAYLYINSTINLEILLILRKIVSTNKKCDHSMQND